MEVTEKRAEGLERELQVVIPATTLDERLTAYLDDLRTKVKLKGFRPGKVPMNHLRKMYGRSAMAEIVNDVMSESIKDAMGQREETPAFQPEVDLDEGAMGEVLAGNKDLAFAVKYDVLPPIEVSGLDTIAIERPVLAVTDEEVEAELQSLAEKNRDYEAVDRAGESGDRLTIAFIGRVDGEAFEGGTAENVDIVIGEGRFIPGFEEQLIGAAPYEQRTVTITFPEDYPAKELAGKEAVFDVTVAAVAAPKPAVLDDAFAERLGMDDLSALRAAMRKQLEDAYAGATRQKVKRALLDALDERFRFELPQTLVKSEFQTIWRQVSADMERAGRTFEAEGERSEEKLKADYEAIAERRVRLGLLLSEVGTKANVEVTEEEVQRALAARVREFPGREREVIEYYRKTPAAVASLRAPIFEDKVVDYLLELVSVTDKTVTKEELLAADPDDDGLGDPGPHDHDHDHGHDHDHDHHHHHDH